MSNHDDEEFWLRKEETSKICRFDKNFRLSDSMQYELQAVRFSSDDLVQKTRHNL
ncbi:hypothetical protein YC2023_011231 [Brassica napus]